MRILSVNLCRRVWVVESMLILSTGMKPYDLVLCVCFANRSTEPCRIGSCSHPLEMQPILLPDWTQNGYRSFSA